MARFIEVYNMEARAVGIENRVFRFTDVKEEQCDEDYKDDENHNDDTSAPGRRGVRMAEAPVVVVWAANRDNQVSIGATLNFTAAGDLVLRDVDGSTVWTTNIIGKSIVGMNLTDVGNLVLFDFNGKLSHPHFSSPIPQALAVQFMKIMHDGQLYFNFIVDMVIVNKEACKQACLNKCACKAALFQYHSNSSSGDCYLPTDLFTPAKKSFLAEVESMGSVHHVNLVRLRGFCVWKAQHLLVYEFMSNGSLDQWTYPGDREHVIINSGAQLTIQSKGYRLLIYKNMKNAFVKISHGKRYGLASVGDNGNEAKDDVVDNVDKLVELYDKL
ncbi:hypothetical protein L6452_32412 [Arctium lappa]|uniref:Uncharacterized protein n=1 Tax=Arctium lappa TaxID=4217 RepID=A0ACB8Z4Q7_ARCLA|nr:hypothetical protein L6452_32412 [Arctium lappa]